MSNNTQDNKVITMPAELETVLFDVVSDEDRAYFLPSNFDGDYFLSGEYERLNSKNAFNRSDDHVAGSWTMAKLKSGDSFFMYPSDDAKTYTINGLDNDEIVVDNKIFGLINTYATFDEASCRPVAEQAIADAYIHHTSETNEALNIVIAELFGDDETEELADLKKQVYYIFELMI